MSKPHCTLETVGLKPVVSSICVVVGAVVEGMTVVTGWVLSYSTKTVVVSTSESLSGQLALLSVQKLLPATWQQ